MTLDEAEAAIGRTVIYRPTGGPPELGVITSVNEEFVFVRYGMQAGSQATRSQDLTFVDGEPIPIPFPTGIGHYILDDQGEPVPEPDICKWGRWFENTENRIVARDEVGDAQVSTVFLGLDHSFLGVGAPVLWESMVFGGPLDGEQERYTSKAEALAGHADMVTRALS